MNANISVNQAAFLVTTALAAVTAGSVYEVVHSASKTAQIAFGLLAVTASGASFGSIAAWMDKSSKNLDKYFANVQRNSAFGVIVMYQFVALTMLSAVLQGAHQRIFANMSGQATGYYRE